MNSNIPAGFKNIDNLPKEDNLYVLAGLVNVGINEDGEIEWLGTKSEWDRYEELYNMYYGSLEN